MQVDCGGDHTHTQPHTLTHAHTLTHSLTVIIWLLERKRLCACDSPLQRAQIIQPANEFDWLLNLIKCMLHTGAADVGLS